MTNTTRDRAKPLGTTIPFSAWIKPFSAVWAFSFQKNLRAAFVGAWDTAKARLFTIENRLKNLFAMRAFPLLNLGCADSLPAKPPTFNAAKLLPTPFMLAGIKLSAALKAIYPPFRNLLSAIGMLFRMFFPPHNLKILDAVISFNFINMMDTFGSFKFTPKVFFHHIPMLKHLRAFSIFVRGIVANVYQNIAVAKRSSALPIMMFWATLSSKFFLHMGLRLSRIEAST